MTEKEEKILTRLSITFLFIVIILSFLSWKRQTKNEEDIFLKNHISTTSYVFQKGDGLTEGDVEKANARHADGFVKLISKESILGTKHENAESIQENDSIWAVISYNNEFVLPDYDSLDFARDISEGFSQYFQTQDITMEESSDAELKKAMQPAIIIESNLPMGELQFFISESLENIFTEENNKQ